MLSGEIVSGNELKEHIKDCFNHNQCPIVVKADDESVGGYIDKITDNGNYHIKSWKLTPFSTKVIEEQIVSYDTLINSFKIL